jgi:hypothetical protein
MTDATLLSPPSDGLQVTVVDAQDAPALRRALASATIRGSRCRLVPTLFLGDAA